MDTIFKQVLETLLTTATGGNSGQSRQAAEILIEEYNTAFDIDIQSEYDRQQLSRQAYMCKLRNTWETHRAV
jgi:hypothetical protein